MGASFVFHSVDLCLSLFPEVEARVAEAGLELSVASLEILTLLPPLL